MNTYEKLHEYHIQQGNIISSNSERLSKQGLVKDYKDIYPDLKGIFSDPGSSVSYIRGNVPLKLTSLLYDKTIVYLPPWPKDLIEKRFGLSYKDFLTLCRNNIVIPIIGNSHDYSASHFEPLFRGKLPPPSLWARGVALLDVFGMSDTLEIARQKIPVERIASTLEIQKKWADKLPGISKDDLKKAIMDDVSVMYADLCIFGYEYEAQEVGRFQDMQKVYESLQILNEAITYPVLFGLDSQATYNPDKFKNSISKLYVKPQYSVQPLPIPPDLEVLLQGIGVNVDTISLEDIIKYRNDGFGVALRKALNSFEDYCNKALNGDKPLERDYILAYAETFQKQIKMATCELTPQKYKKFDTFEKHLMTSIKIGGFGIGGLLGYTIDGNLATIAVISGFTGGILKEILTFPKAKEIVNWILNFCLTRNNSKYMVNIWECKKIVDTR